MMMCFVCRAMKGDQNGREFALPRKIRLERAEFVSKLENHQANMVRDNAQCLTCAIHEWCDGWNAKYINLASCKWNCPQQKNCWENHCWYKTKANDFFYKSMGATNFTWFGVLAEVSGNSTQYRSVIVDVMNFNWFGFCALRPALHQHYASAIYHISNWTQQISSSI